jgi:hypothetical protein
VIHFSADVAIIFYYYYFNDLFYIYINKKNSGGGSATPLGHMGVVSATPILVLRGGFGHPPDFILFLIFYIYIYIKEIIKIIIIKK